MISNKSCSCLKINWNHPLDSATPWLCCRAAIFLAFRVSNLTSSSIVDSADAPPTSASYVPFSRTLDGLVIQMVHRLPPARDEAKALSRWNDMTTLLNRQDHEKYHRKVIWNGQKITHDESRSSMFTRTILETQGKNNKKNNLVVETLFLVRNSSQLKINLVIGERSPKEIRICLLQFIFIY